MRISPCLCLPFMTQYTRHGMTLQEHHLTRQLLSNNNATPTAVGYCLRCTDPTAIAFVERVRLHCTAHSNGPSIYGLLPVTSTELVLRAPNYDSSAYGFVLQNLPVYSPAYRTLLRDTLHNGAYMRTADSSTCLR